MTADTPSGLDLKPKAPQAERLSKRAGLVAFVLLVALFGLIIYGIATRQPLKNDGSADKKSADSASLAAREIAGEIPDGNLGRVPRPSGTAARDAAPEPVSYESSDNSGPRSLSAEERLLAEAFALEQEARRAGTGTGVQSASGNGALSIPGGTGNNPLAGLLGALGGQGGGGLESLLNQGASGGPDPLLAARLAGIANPSGNSEYAIQNDQKFKNEFQASAAEKAKAAYLKSQRTAQLTPYEVKSGWDIPAVLEQGINSDLPGEMKALVTQNVYDTATGKHLLIPQGTRALGVYSSNISFAQDGVQVVWTRLIFPDASSIDLGAMTGQDAAGYSGFRDQVDNHWGRVIGAALLSSVFSAGFQISQGSQSNATGVSTNRELFAAAAGQEVSRVGSEITRRSLNIQPTIEIRPGYRFNIRVNRDMLFESPYSTMRAAR